MRSPFVALALGMCLAVSAARAADEKPATVDWSGQTTAGAAVKVPDAERPSVLVFVRAEQPQSQQALKQAATVLADDKAAQVLVVVSGQQAAERAKALSETLKLTWPLVADPEYALSGKMSVHVWPTTVIVNKAGAETAHLAGLPKSYASSLSAHLDFAAGKIDAAALKTRLETHDIVGDTPADAAARHLQVAQRLIDRERYDQARAEIESALKLQPKDPALLLAMGRVLVLLKQPDEAIKFIDQVPAGAAPAWQVSLARGRAFVAQEKWDQAKAVLPDALKLSPDASEAHYLLGLVYAHEKDWQKAAEEFKAAYDGRRADKTE